MVDVARSSGVSQSTVSRVLNNDQTFSVRPEVKELIHRTARSLNYRPSLAARSLRSQRGNLVAIMGFHSSWPVATSTSIYNAAIRGLVHQLHEAGFDAFTTFPHRQRSDDEMPPWRIDGAVVLNAGGSQAWEELERAAVPYVSINGSCGPHGMQVLVDDFAGMRQVMNHLVSLGHQRIAYTCPDTSEAAHYSVRQRRDAYVAWFQEAGVKSVPFQPSSDLAAWLRHMVQNHQVTAVVAYHLAEAIHLLDAARHLNLRVPEDLSLVSFDDEFPASVLNPPLTTVALPSQRMGELAAELLIEKLNSKEWPAKADRKVMLEEKLIVRGSTAPPENGVRGD